MAVSLGVPAVFAAESAEPSMEQRTEQFQATTKDAWLDGKLEASLLFNQYLNSFDIDTDVKNGVAYLSGAVESDIDKDLAGEIAKSIKGINDVQNDLVVDKAKALQGSDNAEAMEREDFKSSVLNATLTARVKSQLLLNGNTSGLAIDVDSSDGVVTLSGEVSSGQEKALAIQIAKNTDGAKSVIDHLKVEA
jgi:osmotically-inducible protein OsmY